LIPAGIAARTQDSMAAAQWGGSLERAARPREAQAAFALATRLDPANAIAWGRRAVLTERSAGVEASLSILDEGIARGADGSLLRAERGTARLRAGDPGGAEEDLRRALEGFPRDPLLSRDLAVSLLAQGEDLEADSLLRHPGLARDPTALAARAILAARTGEQEIAVLLADQARRLGPVLLPDALGLLLPPAPPAGEAAPR
jgi:Flp pilus assembly protein TadD